MNNDARGVPHGAEIEDLLVSRMREDLARPRWWRTVRGRITIAGASVAIASTAIAGVVLLESRPVTDTGIVHCLDSTSRNVDGSLPGAAVSIAAPGGTVPIHDAVDVCRKMWAAGSLHEQDPLNPTPAPAEVPDEFTVCVTREGSAAVVPGRIECSVLKLHPYDEDVSGESRDDAPTGGGA